MIEASQCPRGMRMGKDTPGSVRIAQNESRRRERNEQIEAHNAVINWVDPAFADWLCECASESCSEPVQLTIEEYEAVRRSPTQFLIAPSLDHVSSHVEQVVQRGERYWVVEKIGVAADVSEELDPRE
jgi:hypothetical protein